MMAAWALDNFKLSSLVRDAPPLARVAKGPVVTFLAMAMPTSLDGLSVDLRCSAC